MVFAADQKALEWGGGGGGVSMRTLPSFLSQRNRAREAKGPDNGHTVSWKQEGKQMGLSLTLTAAKRAKHSLMPGKEETGTGG